MRLQVALFTLIKVLYNTTYRMVYPFLSAFASGLGVDLAAFSVMFAVRSLSVLLAPFLAPIADRRGRKASMLLGLVIFVLGAGLVALWPSYLTFFAAVVLTAFAGNSIFTPAMQAHLGDRVPYARRGRVLAVTEISWSLAFIFCVPLVGLLIGASGWMAPFPLLAGVGVVLVAALALAVPSSAAPARASGPLLRSLKQALSYRPALAALVMGFALTTANESVNLVFGVWLEDSFGLKLAALGAASAAIGLAELSGEGLTALLADRLGKERAIRGGIILSLLATLGLNWAGGSEAGALAGLFFFYLTFEFTIVSSLPLVSEILPAGRASLIAANFAAFALGRAAGSLIAPWLYQDLGFHANTISALLFNLLALAALQFIRLPEHNPSEY
jgi:predicted MFS family arabinose efflux permease